MHKSIFLALIACSSAFAATSSCTSAPAACSPDACKPCYCLGPNDVIANAPINPRTCDGDVVITASALYWKATQDGMEYAIETILGEHPPHDILDASYKTPKFKPNFGCKAGVSYNSPCDGWDIGLIWTHYKGNASSYVETELNDPIPPYPDDGRILAPLWSAFHGRNEAIINPIFSRGLYASDISSRWNCDMTLIDIALGRKYWLSKQLSFRALIGVRIADLDQEFSINHQGGGWSHFASAQPEYNDVVELENVFKGVGVRSGFETNWAFGCGWSLYGDLAASILYGTFTIEHDEAVRLCQTPFSKQKVLETKEQFRASRAILDLALGIEYSALVCDCKYGITTRLSWEQHSFFHQNQMWRVNRIGNDPALANVSFPNNGGENDFYQRRGTLSTSGLTLTFEFAF